MSWWKITYQSNNKVYHSDQLPFSLLPGIQETSTQLGHKFDRTDIICEVADRIKLDLETGAIWLDKKIVAAVTPVERLILKKRNFRLSNNKTSQHIYAGLISSDGKGYLIRLTEEGDAFLEKCVISVNTTDVVQ